MSKVTDDIKPILPKNGQLIIEDLQEFVLCKPRLIPLKSYTLEKLEEMQKQIQMLQEEEANKSEEED